MEQLTWLVPHPDLRSAIRAARDIPDPAARLATARHLAGHRRDFLATAQIARLLDSVDGPAQREAGVFARSARLGIVGSHTVEHLVPSIRVAALQRGLDLEVLPAAYGQYRQQLLAGDPAIAAFGPQLILLALDAVDLAFDLPLDADEGSVAAAVDARVDELRQLWRCARERYGARVIQQTVLPVVPPVFGCYEGLVPAAPFALVERLNERLRAAAREDGTLLLDLAWHPLRGAPGIGDPVLWHHAKQLVSPLAAPAYGDLVARVTAAAMGMSRKCLVLDLDDTLWGGVVGEDGIDGITLGQGSAAGEAFASFQRYVALLAASGVVLAVCSKNSAEVAEAAFREHPEMVLARDQVACFVANWQDKASNLRRIARTLDLGLDALVFVDDNPAERDIIRRELPDVAVPELPDDVSGFAAVLAAAGYFEPATFTADDASRNLSYAANAKRQAMLEAATDLDAYLQGLEMRLVARPIEAVDLQRSVQLVNKSNQFNLASRRYSDAAFRALLDDPGTIARCLRLVDRFGDNGLISVLVARTDDRWQPGELLIDTWLMSCRVLGRGVESAALEVLLEGAAALGASALIGEYRPTARNGLVAEHYARLGFDRIDPPADAPEGASYWRWPLSRPAPGRHFISRES